MAYSKNPHWALVCEPGLLLLHAGGDELFAIDDVSEAAAGEILTLWRAEVMRPGDLSADAADVFAQLVAAGIVHNLIEPRLEYTLGVRFAGTRDVALEAAIVRALPAGIALGGNEPDDLVLVVRTDGALADIVGDDYASLTTPHLLLDLAFGHMVCLGPLVFVAQTACLSCLVGRLTFYWGDLTPPSRPRMTEHPQLSGGLVAMTIANILQGRDRSLVNRTVAYDFRAHDVQAHSVYRLPMCATCGNAAAAGHGSLALPWVGAR